MPGFVSGLFGDGIGEPVLPRYERIAFEKSLVAVQIEGLIERAAARRFGLDPRTVAKIVKFSVPPGYLPQAYVAMTSAKMYLGLLTRAAL